jgi:D-arabinose 1-dehydrogenase-like Zn-dependent alcohol dehydrogenase
MQTIGYAALQVNGPLVPWEFTRRAVGDNDVLIEILYAGICHSDIHQVKGEWGNSVFPMVPGHEIVRVSFCDRMQTVQTFRQL